MKKRLIRAAALLFALTVLFGMAGCMTMQNPFDEEIDDSENDHTVVLMNADATIYAPQINQGPFGYSANVQPGALIRLDFNPGRDQYGNKTGLSASRYTIETVTAKCEFKTEADTIFSTNDDNEKVWFPAYTAPIENISGLPIPLYPLSGYPWDPCRPSGIGDMGSQTAVITATARAEWIEVEFTLPEENGPYKVDLPGQTWSETNIIRLRIGSPGNYTIHANCGDCEAILFTIPIEWFFISAQWSIDIGPTSVCR